MLVGQSNFQSVIETLNSRSKLAIDTETFGLRPYHGDRLFSIIIADEKEEFYFNFKPYPDLSSEWVLLPVPHLQAIRQLLGRDDILWYLHNAKYDMAILGNEEIEIKGTIHCTQVGGRIVYNDHFKYDLSTSLERIGLKKDDTVEKYIEENGLFEIIQIPGKKTKVKNKHYDLVPFDIIVPYGCKDGRGTYALGVSQDTFIEKESGEVPTRLPTLRNIQILERRLTKTVFNMERCGVLIDREYCVQAASYEVSRGDRARENYKRDTGRDFVDSGKNFQATFASERDKWVWGEPTKTGQINPSFDSEVLKKFDNPAAREILTIRDAKSKADFYHGFLYHADSKGRVHPNFNPGGTVHGRLSSSGPNFQNLSADEDATEEEFTVRRAIIPTPGYVLFMPDYSTLEYKFALELACRMAGRMTPLAQLVKDGLDYHQATADLASATGIPITRSPAKTVNFLTLYGGGNEKLAFDLKCSIDQAKKIRGAILGGAPEIGVFIRAIIDTARRRGWVFNWAGRRCHFSDPNFAYAAPNHLVAGGCADIVKIAMNRIDDACIGLKSRMIMTVHDELPTEVHESEIHTIPRRMVSIMENAFESQYVPLTVGCEWSSKSLGDGVKGFPV